MPILKASQSYLSAPLASFLLALLPFRAYKRVLCFLESVRGRLAQEGNQVNRGCSEVRKTVLLYLKSIRSLVLLAFSCSTFVGLWSSAPAAVSKGAEWQIDYNSSFAGIMRIKLCDKSMSMRLEKMGLLILAEAPQWDCHVFNELNKRCMVMTKDQWKEKFAARNPGKTFGKDTAKGLAKDHGKDPGKNAAKNKSNSERKRMHDIDPETLQTVDTHIQEKIQGLNTEKMELRHKLESGKIETAMEIWVTKAIDVPDQCRTIMRTALRIPQGLQGTPLKLNHRQATTGTMVQDLAVIKVAKVKLNPDDFKMLSGYKEVKNEVNLMLDDENESGDGGGLMGPEK